MAESANVTGTSAPSATENPDEDRVGAEGMINDIGTYVGRRLTDEEKYYLLTETFILVRSYAFPATLIKKALSASVAWVL